MLSDEGNGPISGYDGAISGKKNCKKIKSVPESMKISYNNLFNSLKICMFNYYRIIFDFFLFSLYVGCDAKSRLDCIGDCKWSDYGCVDKSNLIYLSRMIHEKMHIRKINSSGLYFILHSFLLFLTCRV